MGKAIEFADEETVRAGLSAARYHPLVRTHPETGEESLYICDTYTVGFEGMTTFEAKPIVDFLVAHCTQAAFTCRLRWEAGHGGDVGQPRRDAPRAERLRRLPARDVPDDDRGDEAGMTTRQSR